MRKYYGRNEKNPMNASFFLILKTKVNLNDAIEKMQVKSKGLELTKQKKKQDDN